MKKQLVYDLPTRIFHWAFAVFFVTAFLIAKLNEGESPNFPYHMLAGLTLSFLIILRLIWGFTGTKHARFANFALSPKDLLTYLKGVFSGSKQRWAGHNPASSWAAIGMMTLGLCLGLTGILMTSGAERETFEDIHAIFAYAFLFLVFAHIAGIATHTIRHKEVIGLSMIEGHKENIAPTEAIPSAKNAWGFSLLALLVGFVILLSNNYDTQTKTLHFFKWHLEFAEKEKAEQPH